MPLSSITKILRMAIHNKTRTRMVPLRGSKIMEMRGLMGMRRVRINLMWIICPYKRSTSRKLEIISKKGRD